MDKIKRKAGRPKGSGNKPKSKLPSSLDGLRRKPGRPSKKTSRLVPIPVTEEFYEQKPAPTFCKPCYYEPWMCDKLIEIYSQGGNLDQACIALGIRNADTIREWRKKFPEFEEAWQWAKSYGRAFDEKLLLQGIQGEIKGYNATAHAMRLNSRYPDDYRRSGSPDATHNTVNINTINMSSQERQDKIVQLSQKLQGMGFSLPHLGQLEPSSIIETDVLENAEEDNNNE